MDFGFDGILVPIYHQPARLVALELEVRPIGCNLHLRRGCHVHGDIVELFLEIAVVVSAEHVLQVFELGQNFLDFHHILQVVVQVHKLVVAKAGRMVHEEYDLVLDLRDFFL